MRRALVSALVLAAVVLGCAPPEVAPPTTPAVAPPAMTKVEPLPITFDSARALTRTPTAREPRRLRLESAISQTLKRDVRSDNGFWTVFHAILGLGPKAVTLVHPATEQRVNALDYIRKGGELRGLIFKPSPHGVDVESSTGPQMQWLAQGHQDQFVAEMAQWRVAIDLPFRVQGRDYTFRDFVRHAQMRSSTKQKPAQELSWAVLVVAEYLGTDAAWTNTFGEPLSVEEMLRYEMAQPMDERAACGGTHRLFGLSWVLNLHRRKGGKAEGVWKEVEEFTNRHKAMARGFQNLDGSLSSKFFRERDAVADRQARLHSTGHTFEWLALALTDAELREEWVGHAADTLALMFQEIEGAPMESGALYHAVHGLLLYYARLYGPEWLGELTPAY